MNLSMKTKAVNNQLKLFDENTYLDPNAFHVGDLIGSKEGYESWHPSVVKEINSDIVKTMVYNVLKKDWNKLYVIRKYEPAKFKENQEVWWDGLYIDTYAYKNGKWEYIMNTAYHGPEKRKILKIELWARFGYLYLMEVGSWYTHYTYPEHLKEI